MSFMDSCSNVRHYAGRWSVSVQTELVLYSLTQGSTYFLVSFFVEYDHFV